MTQLSMHQINELLLSQQLEIIIEVLIIINHQDILKQLLFELQLKMIEKHHFQIIDHLLI
jgi:hypothetical protein